MAELQPPSAPPTPPATPETRRLWPQGAIPREKILRWGAVGGACLIALLFFAVSRPPKQIAQPTVGQFDPGVTPPPAQHRLDGVAQDLDEQRKQAERQAKDLALQMDQARKDVDRLQHLVQDLGSQNGMIPIDQPRPIATGADPRGPGTNENAKPHFVSNIVEDLRPVSLVVPSQTAQPQQSPAIEAPANDSVAASQSTEQGPEDVGSKLSGKRNDLLKADAAWPSVVLPEGLVIECTLENKLAGSNVGIVKAITSTDVYAVGTRTLIFPQGTEFIGDSAAVNILGQDRLAVKFHRAIVHQGNGAQYSVSLDGDPPGLDAEGAAGLTGKVNSHMMSIFGASLAIGALGGLANIGNTGTGYSTAGQFQSGIAQGMSQSAMHVLDRFLNRMPTVVIPPGSLVRLMLVGDLRAPTFRRAVGA